MIFKATSLIKITKTGIERLSASVGSKHENLKVMLTQLDKIKIR